MSWHSGAEQSTDGFHHRSRRHFQVALAQLLLLWNDHDSGSDPLIVHGDAALGTVVTMFCIAAAMLLS